VLPKLDNHRALGKAPLTPRLHGQLQGRGFLAALGMTAPATAVPSHLGFRRGRVAAGRACGQMLPGGLVPVLRALAEVIHALRTRAAAWARLEARVFSRI